MHLLGLPLPLALNELGERETRIIETAPPFAPRHYTPIWGELRILRARETADGVLELLVARELLREEKPMPRAL